MGAKGKLSFLGSSKQIEVISSTYIGPKKSMLLVRVHKQLFLVGSSETGMSLISEIKNPAELLKGEIKEINGTNFDLDLTQAQADELLENKVKLKSDPNSGLEAFLNQNKSNDVSEGAVVKFSDQIKKKVKGLKPLQ